MCFNSIPWVLSNTPNPEVSTGWLVVPTSYGMSVQPLYLKLCLKALEAEICLFQVKKCSQKLMRAATQKRERANRLMMAICYTTQLFPKLISTLGIMADFWQDLAACILPHCLCEWWSLYPQSLLLAISSCSLKAHRLTMFSPENLLHIWKSALDLPGTSSFHGNKQPSLLWGQALKETSSPCSGLWAQLAFGSIPLGPSFLKQSSEKLRFLAFPLYPITQW